MHAKKKERWKDIAQRIIIVERGNKANAYSFEASWLHAKKIHNTWEHTKRAEYEWVSGRAWKGDRTVSGWRSCNEKSISVSLTLVPFEMECNFWILKYATFGRIASVQYEIQPKTMNLAHRQEFQTIT